MTANEVDANPGKNTSTHASLTKRFGAKNVRSEAIQIGEGETEPGTVLFPKDETRRVEILWKDVKRKRNPAMVRFNGNGWQTKEGIRIGVRLLSIEKRNGRPFTLSGFAWDYSGMAATWHRGKLETSNAPCTLVLTFHVPNAHDDERTSKLYEQVIGEKEFLSSHPAMQTLNPVLSEIELDYRR